MSAATANQTSGRAKAGKTRRPAAKQRTEPVFFADQHAFRAWLEKHHTKESALVVGYYKVDSGKPSMTWSESVDQALCFGWIDGVRNSRDAESYTIRFTPRKPTSNWSAINIRKIEELTAKRLMMPAGIAAFANRREEKSRIYGYENRPKELPEEIVKVFRKNKAAWAFFSTQAPSYQRTAAHWVISAKKEETQRSRLEKVIATSAQGKRIF
jgi:uncharacterized protein YdeI (YjbR/CyaY-like superfamily)